MKNLIIDGWILFSYDGIPNDAEDKKTIAFKQLGNNFVEIMWNIKTMSFEFVKNGNDSSQIKCDRFSTCLKMADEWFKLLEE